MIAADALAPEQRERGQTVAEFALVLFPLLLLVVGIVQFGIAISSGRTSSDWPRQGPGSRS